MKSGSIVWTCLSVKQPQKDTFQTCDKLVVLIRFSKDKTNLEKELKQHHKESNLAYQTNIKE
jgi:hypothetical protein